MKKILIGALLATALTAPAFAAEPTTPLRNDLSADDAGVKRAGPGAEAIIDDTTGVTVVPPTDSVVVVTPSNGDVITSVPSGSSSTSGSIIVDRTSEEPLPSGEPTTPLRNDLKSNEAGVKGAVQPQKDPNLPN